METKIENLDRSDLLELARMGAELAESVTDLNRASHPDREDLLVVSRADIDALKEKARTLRDLSRRP